MIAGIVTAFYVAGVLFAVEAAMKTRTAQGAVAWSVSLVSFPFVAVPAYLVFGRNKFEGMVVVDGKVAWVGGHNVGDEYLGLDPDFSPWRDTHVRLEGPVVQQLQITILGDWYWATREFPEVNWSPQPAPEHDMNAMIFPFGPTGKFETASMFFISRLTPPGIAYGCPRLTLFRMRQ